MRWGWLILVLFILGGNGLAQSTQSPAEFFGYTFGDDPRVPDWERIVAYFEHLAETSDRVRFEVVGRSSQDRPLILATVSSRANLERSEEIRRIQMKLADPRTIAPGELGTLIRDGRPAMLFFVAEAAHTASWLSQVLFLHRVATEDTEQVRSWRENTILLFMATMNPDGLDFVHDWVEKTRGTEWEGVDLPELSSFNGEINRDWYTFSMPEARAVVGTMKRWQVNAIHDIHTMGSQPRPGVRFFTPPYIGPVEPNIHPLIWHLQNEMGMAMAGHVLERGLGGVTFNTKYDLWNPARGYAQHHHALRILTEASAGRLSAPTRWRFEDLEPDSGVDTTVPSEKFPVVWHGGEWGNKQILPYIAAALEAEVGHLSNNRERYLRAKHKAASDTLAGRDAPFAYMIPPDQHDPSTMREMLTMLAFGEVEIHRAELSFRADGRSYPAGTYVIPLRQPFGNFAKAMLEPQRYPEVRTCPTCPVRAPYDTVAFSYPYAMGVRAEVVASEFTAETVRVAEFPPEGGALEGTTSRGTYLLPYTENVALKAVARLLGEGVELGWAEADFDAEDDRWPAGTFVITAAPGIRPKLEALASEFGLRFVATEPRPEVSVMLLRLPRVGIYRPYVGGRNGYGFARLLFPEYAIPFEFVLDQDIRDGGLLDRFDAIILPAYRTPRQLLEGHARGSYPPEMTGGISPAGVEQLKRFVAAGGTLLTIGQSTDFAIEQFDLPVERVSGLTVSMFGRPVESDDDTPEAEFVVPGSFLRIGADREHPIAYGMPEEFSGLFNRGQVLSPSGTAAIGVARYLSGQLLLSGMALGEEVLRGKSAVVDVKQGEGHVVLFAIRPEIRLQTRGSYKLLFNALYRSASTRN